MLHNVAAHGATVRRSGADTENQAESIMTRLLRVGTRGSALALRQTELVTNALRSTLPDIVLELRVIKTEGDRNQRESLRVIGGRGVFVRDIEQRLIDGEIDIAVHSLKDLPTAPNAELTLAAVLPRESPFDVLVTPHGGLDTLPRGARIGSSSPRRAAFMRVIKPDARVADVRGNIDTRLRKLDEGQYDALLLAAAGLHRLGLHQRIAHVFSADDMLPAPGQGALVAQCRSDDSETVILLRAIDHAPTRAATEAERAFLQFAGAGCQWPVAALASTSAPTALHLRAAIAREDDARIFWGAATGAWTDAQIMGTTLARQILAQAGNAETQEPPQ